MWRNLWSRAGMAGLMVAWLGGARADKPSASEGKFFCNLRGLSSQERVEYNALTAKLRLSVVETRELEDGFAFRIKPDRLALAELFRWVDLERRCCPFFRFVVDFEPKVATWLQLRGAPGVKSFLRTMTSE